VSGAPWFADGLRFSCLRCGRCCTGEPGYVFLHGPDVGALAAFLGLGREEFVARHVRRVPGGISLLEEPDGRCAFWDEGCRVYPARPRQCRTYPFWRRVVASPAAWAEEARACPGVGSGALHAADEIAAAAGLALEAPGPTPLSSSA
jgi:Fe-S-cluster containining protein